MMARSLGFGGHARLLARLGAFPCVFCGSGLAFTLYSARDPSYLGAADERRGPFSEKETAQKIIQSITRFVFMANAGRKSALDHRFGWWPLPAPLSRLPGMRSFLIGISSFLRLQTK